MNLFKYFFHLIYNQYWAIRKKTRTKLINSLITKKNNNRDKTTIIDVIISFYVHLLTHHTDTDVVFTIFTRIN